MKKNTLGKTGIEVTELGMGGLFVASFGAAFDQARAAVFRALELGINFIDTAPNYADSEEVLGRILEDNDKPLILSTKLGGRPDPFLPQDRDCLMKSVEESLRLLKRDSIDILMIHEPDRPGQYDWWDDYENVNGPVLELLDSLKKDGTIKATGLGGTTAYDMIYLINSGKFDIVLTAFNYSLLWREAEGVIKAAKEQDMGVIIGSPLQQGALAVRYDNEVYNGARWLSPPRRAQFKALYEFLDEIEIPLCELAIRFVISNPAVSCVLAGARSVAEVESNYNSAKNGPLPEDILKRLEEIASMVPFRPFDEPFNFPWDGNYKGPGFA